MSDNSQDITIGNQQERLFFEIGYLAGMVDGEGACQFGYKYYYKGCKVYSPRITIFNTNPEIIRLTKEFLDHLEIPYYYWSPKWKERDQWQGWRVEIGGLKRVKKFTDILLKYPTGKQDRLQVLNDFCNYRLTVNRKKYGLEEQKFFDKLRELNKLYRGKQKIESSETIRSDATA